MNRIEILVSGKRVKLHIFHPSKREIWTVVGKSKEHWLDPNLDFCSCESYYFNKAAGKHGCYHLDSLKRALRDEKFELLKFHDDEFGDFVSGLIDELIYQYWQEDFVRLDLEKRTKIILETPE